MSLEEDLILGMWQEPLEKIKGAILKALIIQKERFQKDKAHYNQIKAVYHQEKKTTTVFNDKKKKGHLIRKESTIHQEN